MQPQPYPAARRPVPKRPSSLTASVEQLRQREAPPSLPEAGPAGTSHELCAEKCTAYPDLLCRKVHSSSTLPRGCMSHMSPIIYNKNNGLEHVTGFATLLHVHRLSIL